MLLQKTTKCLYTKIMERINRHYNPQWLAVVQQFKFNLQASQPGELVVTYVSELMKLSEFCEFPATLDKMQCYHQVYERSQSLCSSPSVGQGLINLYLEIAQAIEMATLGVEDSHAQTQSL